MNQANDVSSRRIQRNRKLLPGLLAAGALAVTAGVGACSSGPTTKGAMEGANGANEGESTSSSQAAESADDCASTPFASAAKCTTHCSSTIGTGSGGGSGIKVQSVHPDTTVCITNCTCPAVTNPPTPAPPPPDGGATTDEVTEPISPPAALAGLGCTEGLSFMGAANGSVWACPVGSAIPGDFGDEPLCADEDASVPICWSVMTATAVSDNPIVGNPLPGWMLVFELNEGIGYIPTDGTCQGGCPAPPPGCTGGCPVPIDPTPSPIHLTY